MEKNKLLLGAFRAVVILWFLWLAAGFCLVFVWIGISTRSTKIIITAVWIVVFAALSIINRKLTDPVHNALEHTPKITEEAEVISKKASYDSDGFLWGHSVTFRLKNGTQKTLHSEDVYNSTEKGDLGLLTYSEDGGALSFSCTDRRVSGGRQAVAANGALIGDRENFPARLVSKDFIKQLMQFTLTFMPAQSWQRFGEGVVKLTLNCTREEYDKFRVGDSGLLSFKQNTLTSFVPERDPDAPAAPEAEKTESDTQ